MKRTIATIAVLGLLCLSSRAQVLISTNTGNTYSQNFDSLASSGSTVAWADNVTLPGWYASRQTGGSFTTYTVSPGTGNTGALYSFGTNGVNPVTDRALGTISSGTPGVLAFGIRFQNDTADLITNIVISYTGEQWRNGGNTSIQTNAFFYRTGAGPLTNAEPSVLAGWTSFNALDFRSPTTGATAAGLDGNAAANRQAFSNVQLTEVTVQPGEEIFLRWYDINDAGNDHGMAVDDLTVSYTRLTVAKTKPSIDVDPQPVSANVWSAVSFSVQASGTPKLRYQWYKGNDPLSDGGNVSGTTNSILNFTGVLHANQGDYKVVVTNDQGSATSAVASLTVQGFAIQPVGVTNTLTGAPVTVTLNFVDNQTPITSVTATSGNQGLLTDANIAVANTGNSCTLTLSPEPGTNGACVVNASASDGSFTTSLSFPLVIVPSTDIVLNDHFDYADGPLTTNSAFLWQNHSGTLGDLQVVSSLVYLSRSATEDANARLIGAPYMTNSGKVLYAMFKVNFSASDTPTAAGTYFAHFKDAEFGFRGRVWVCTNASGNLRVGIGNGSTADASSGQFPLDLSYGTPYTIVAKLVPATGVSTLWINPTSEADTSVTANDGDPATNGINVVSFALRQNSGMSKLYFDDLVVGTGFAAVTGLPALPVITAQPQSRTNISGTLASFAVSATGADVSYRWQFNNAPLSDDARITGSGSLTLNLGDVQLSDAGPYKLVVSNAVGMATSSVANLTVWTIPAFTSDPQSLTNDPGTIARFSAAASGVPSPTYRWQFQGAPLSDDNHYSGSTSGTLYVTNVQSLDVGGYALVASSLAGSRTSAVANLTVKAAVPNRIAMSYQRVGNSLTFTWSDPSFSLAFSTNVTGQYNKIPGALSGFTTNMSDFPAGFFRLVWP